MAEDPIGKLLRGSMTELLRIEDLLIESMRDLVREELKRKVREELERSPELREELREAVRMLFEAKVQEAYAGLKLAKAATKLGLELLPDELRAQIGREVSATLEREVARLLERTM